MCLYQPLAACHFVRVFINSRNQIFCLPNRRVHRFCGIFFLAPLTMIIPHYQQGRSDLYSLLIVALMTARSVSVQNLVAVQTIANNHALPENPDASPSSYAATDTHPPGFRRVAMGMLSVAELLIAVQLRQVIKAVRKGQSAGF